MDFACYFENETPSLWLFFFFGLVLTSDLSKPLDYILTVEMMHWSNLNPESTETKIAHPFAKKI